MVKIKRALALALAMAMCLALVSCGSSDTAEEEAEIEEAEETELEEEIPEHEYTSEDLDGLISGVTDKGYFTTEDEVDLIEDVEWDEDIIQSVTLNEDEIDLSTEGKYDAVYTVTAYQNPLDYRLDLTDEIATLDEEMPEDYVTIDIEIDTTVYVLDESNSCISDIAILLGADVDLFDAVEFNEDIFESFGINEDSMDRLTAGEYEVACTAVADKDVLDSYFESLDKEVDDAELSAEAENEAKTDNEELSSSIDDKTDEEELSSSPEGEQTDEELSSAEEAQSNQTNKNDAVEAESDTGEGEQEELSSFEGTEIVEFAAVATVYVVPEENATEWLSEHEGLEILTSDGVYEPAEEKPEEEADESQEETAADDAGSASDKATQSTGGSSSSDKSGSSTGSSGSNGSAASTGSTSSSSSSKSSSSSSSHVHNWQPVYRTETSETGHYEEVVVKEGVYEGKYVCNVCFDFYTDNVEDIGLHQRAEHDGYGGYTVRSVCVQEPVTETQWVVDGTTTITVLDHYECSCGATTK